MCGITGFIDYKNHIQEAQLNNASFLLKHRGGNGQGFFIQRNENFTIGLAHQRLAIIDISIQSNQPISSKCGNYFLVFNGIIYNHKELKEQLLKKKYEFHSNSDTEVLLNAFIEWEEECFKKLEGIFAIAIYNKKKQQILFIRDRVGAKPLFYYFSQNMICFSSEIKALKAYNLNLCINKESLNNFLKFGYFPTSESIYKNILKVKPAHILKIDLKEKSTEQTPYWQLPTTSFSKNNIEDIIYHTKLLLKKSVISRTISDVPIGVLLSGGYDSATVAAILQNASNKKTRTYTIGFEDDNFNEAKEAKRIADYLGTDHNEYFLTSKEAINFIKNIGKIYDEPMGDSGAIALCMAASVANNDVKVLLSAEGGDELFGGYNSYYTAISWYKFFKKIPKFNLKNIIPHKFNSLILSRSLLEFHQNITCYFYDEEIKNLTGKKNSPITLNCFKDDLNTLLDFDLQHYLPEDLLMKSDRTMMYFGIENREPFLDHQLIEYLSQIPSPYKYYNKEPKYILKQITHSYIPEALMRRPKKGFSIPLESWLKNDLKNFVKDNLYNNDIKGLVNKEETNKILNSFFNNKKGYYRKIWILLSLKLWSDVHLT